MGSRWVASGYAGHCRSGHAISGAVSQGLDLTSRLPAAHVNGQLDLDGIEGGVVVGQAAGGQQGLRHGGRVGAEVPPGG